MIITNELGTPALNTVHNCDALRLLGNMPSNSVDIVVTSPPYNIGSDHRRGGGFAEEKLINRKLRDSFYEDGEDVPEPEYQAWLYTVVAECLRVSRGLVWINHKTRFRGGVGIHPLEFLKFPVYSEIIWARPGSFMLNSKRFAQSHEYVFGFGKPHYWDDTVNSKCTVWHIPAVQNSAHACPYPEQLIEPLILGSCPLNGIVLDPFMGSGTSAMVAKRLGRQFIGSEINGEYIEYSRGRLGQIVTLDHLPLFAQKPA